MYKEHQNRTFEFLLPAGCKNSKFDFDFRIRRRAHIYICIYIYIYIHENIIYSVMNIHIYDIYMYIYTYIHTSMLYECP